MTKLSKTCLLGASAAMLLAACANERVTPPNVMLEGLPTDRHEIQVERATQVLEIALDPAYPTLRREDLRAIERFVAAYRDRGHGGLIMAMPENGPNQQLAVEAVRRARELAWENGVAYERIDGSSYDSHGTNAPLLLAFDAYEAQAPECLSLAAYDMSEVSSNNEPSYFGCTIAYNIAAMLSDPGDLLGERELDAANPERISLIMEAYRTGAVEVEAVSASGN